ncbi:MAG: hypothetical protein HY390_05100 [Deltaproteobacteria bacterium]|nr:hypothetical protein [Deltaproteobacteria bacterium]
MNDTHPAIAKKIKTLMGRKSGEERLMMGFSMFDAAKKMVLASLSSSKLNTLTPIKRKYAVLLRFYGNDLSENLKKKILHSWQTLA